MHQKHYRETAEIIRGKIETAIKMRPSPYAIGSYDTAEFIAREMADIFRVDNPRFDRARFYAACGLEEYQ